MKILVTGAAGFIGAFLSKRLLDTTSDEIIGLDNLNDYYDVSLKEARLDMLKGYSKFKFIKGDISDKAFIDRLFDEYKFDVVVNLAAQAGVRYSIDHPDVYIHDGGEYGSSGSGNLAHAVSDKSDESQALGNSYTADALKLCQKSVAEN